MDLQAIAQDQNPWWREPATQAERLHPRVAQMPVRAHFATRRYPIRRDLQPLLLEALLRPEERRAALLIGPRQVGKTVLLRQLADDLLNEGLDPANLFYFDFSDDRVTEEISPRQVAEIRPVDLDEDQPRFFLFDEIRLGKGWDRWLKQAVDQRLGRIVATDSAASLLRVAGRESGQGRWDEYRIEGLSFREFVKFNGRDGEHPEQVVRRLPNLVEQYLKVGGFPAHALNDDFPEVRRRLRLDIVERAILRDVSRYVDDPPRCRDLFVYLVQNSGALFNATKRADDMDMDYRTVGRWLELLEDTLLLVRLPKYAEHAAARLRAQPKIFAADPGLVEAFSLLPARDEDVRAKVFEVAVFRHLRELLRERGGDLSFYRRAEAEEVDFVIERPGEKGLVVAVEVTSSRQVKSKKVQKLRRAVSRLGADRSVLIHGALVEEQVEGIEAIPIQKFLLDPEVLIRGEE